MAESRATSFRSCLDNERNSARTKLIRCRNVEVRSCSLVPACRVLGVSSGTEEGIRGMEKRGGTWRDVFEAGRGD